MSFVFYFQFQVEWVEVCFVVRSMFGANRKLKFIIIGQQIKQNKTLVIFD